VRVVAVFVGMPRSVTTAGGKLFTGGAKSSVADAFLHFSNFAGDGQGDLRHHGGRDRSACVYVADHYDWWKTEYGFDLRHGAFGENLTIQGALEHLICVGDVFRVGKALVQVSQPRDPCHTIDRLAGVPGLWTRARDSGRLGFHMRTLEEGLVRAGDAFEIVRRHPEGISVARVLDLYHGRSQDRELAKRLAHLAEFADQGKKIITERLPPGVP